MKVVTQSILVTAVIVVFFACSVFAAEGPADGYTPGKWDEPFQWKGWVVIAICVLGLAGCALKNSRRHSEKDA